MRGSSLWLCYTVYVIWVTVSMLTFFKVQSCKLYNDKYMITGTQITYSEIFASLAVLVFKLLSYKILFINRKGSRYC